MDNPTKLYQVIKEDGADLRRIPSMKLKTEDGKENVILSMPFETLVVEESDEVRTGDEYEWLNVRPVFEEKDLEERDENKIGWVVSDHLVQMFMASSPAPTIYTFKFENKDRDITEQNLETAVNGKIFSKMKLTNNQTQITLDKDFQETKTYWVTRDNLKKVTISPKVT
ncbi:MAG TPA: hypothetical protein VK851_05025 [Anaerolineales bacterium]|nr:hypothetical protein [Anaerolineales bacterium]